MITAYTQVDSLLAQFTTHPTRFWDTADFRQNNVKSIAPVYVNHTLLISGPLFEFIRMVGLNGPSNRYNYSQGNMFDAMGNPSGTVIIPSGYPYTSPYSYGTGYNDSTYTYQTGDATPDFLRSTASTYGITPETILADGDSFRMLDWTLNSPYRYYASGKINNATALAEDLRSAIIPLPLGGLSVSGVAATGRTINIDWSVSL